MNAPHEQHLLQARRLLQGNRVAEAKQLLTVLANQSHAPAMYDLAHVLLIEADDTDPDGQALAWLRRAEALAYAPAIYRMAVFSLSDALVALDWQELAARLSACCRMRHPEALCDAALLYARCGDDRQRQMATGLLEAAALHGSTVAMALLGERLASGLHGDADPARANSIRRLAAGSGMPVPAPDPNAGFAKPDPAQAPVLPDTLDFSALASFVQAPAGHLREPQANVQSAEAFLSPEECLYIQCLGGPQLQPSISVDPNGQAQRNRIRTSHDFLFTPQSETVALKLLQMRMAAFAGLPLQNAEALVLLRYAPGQEYLPHRDYLPPSHFTAIKDGGSGQRLRTVISYLNTPAEGGDTAFPLLGMQVAAVAGRILRFDSIQPDGRLNAASLHAGTPVKQGLKWICTLWLREQGHRVL